MRLQTALLMFFIAMPLTYLEIATKLKGNLWLELNHMNIIFKLSNKLVSVKFIKWIRMLKKKSRKRKKSSKIHLKVDFRSFKICVFSCLWRICWFYIAVKFQNTIEYIYSRQRRFFQTQSFAKLTKSWSYDW